MSAREIGVKTYFHNLVLSAAGSQIVYIVIATDTSTPFTTSSLEEWLKNKGFIMKPATSLIGANPDFSKSKIYSPPKLSIVVEEGAYLNNEYPIMIVVGIYYYQYTDGSGSAQLVYYSGNSFNINNSISLSIISDIVLDMI